ncbi:hypothetical protein [Paenibacillus larvae]|uniref:hypothetical protein n=1 Tax=Paenibacillus larvae TaxID=1464 RepID=UPI001F3C14D9|nr:hypothetical protein [Paenibacillus larvae]
MGTKQTLIPIGENRWQVKVPLPFPLRWVNSYVFRGRDGFTVLDPDFIHRNPKRPGNPRWQK